MLTKKHILMTIRMMEQTTEPEEGFGHFRRRPIQPRHDDGRPCCCCCGRRWTPAIGVYDARVVPCSDCRASQLAEVTP